LRCRRLDIGARFPEIRRRRLRTGGLVRAERRQVQEDLDVFFRGKRSYIQGSQILTLAAALPALRLGHEGPLLLREAAFTALVATGVRAVLGGEGAHGFGSARFSVGGEDRDVRFLSVPEAAPPRLDDEPSRLESLALAGDLCGEAVAVIREGFGDFLCAVVEANKRIHERVAEGVHDVWFTGLRKAAIPAGAGALPGRVRLAFTSLMQRRQGSQRQSLSRVEVHGEGDAPVVPPFLCTFAYKL
jgi:hypothetical protein